MRNYKEILTGIWNIIKSHTPDLIEHTQKRVSKKKFKFNFNNIVVSIKNKKQDNLNIFRYDIKKDDFEYNDIVLNIHKNYYDKFNYVNSDNLNLPFKILLGSKEDSIGIFINNVKHSKIIGLGEKFSGIIRDNKVFENYTQDQYFHTFYTDKLYSAQNIFYIVGKNYFSLIYLNFPGKVIYDFKKTDKNLIAIECFGKNIIMDVIISNNFQNLVQYLYKIIEIKDIFPLFIFGNSFSRWGIENIKELENIIKNFNESDIPIDNIFLDIDYMDNYKLFTIDNDRFKNLDQFILEKNKDNLYFIPIMDVGIKIEEGYHIYNEFKNENLLVKKENGEIFKGSVWPGSSVFPDFLNKKAFNKWKEVYKSFLLNNNFSGFWNDMNEPSVFDTNTGTFTNDVVFCLNEGNKKNLEHINNIDNNNNLNNNVNNKNSLDKNNIVNNNNLNKNDNTDNIKNNRNNLNNTNLTINNICYKDIEIHNIYSYLQNKASYQAFIEAKKRPLIISRADYTFSGKYSGTWTGDNTANYKNLKIGYSQIINYNIIGMPFCGTDIGGFIGDPDDKLIVKWYKNSIFHPLFRNHSSKFSKRREPYLFKEKTKKQLRILSLIRTKFSLLIYNQFFKMIEENIPPIKPVFYYYQDYDLFSNDYQLFIDKNVMHILDYKKKELGKIKAYFPEGLWVNYFTTEKINSKGEYINIYSNWGLPDIWVKIPSIFVTSNFRNRVMKNIFPIIEIFPDEKIFSYEFFEDDFISLEYKNGIFNRYKVDAKINIYIDKSLLNIYLNLNKNIKFNSNFNYLTFKINLNHIEWILENKFYDNIDLILKFLENYKIKIILNGKEIHLNKTIPQKEFNDFIEPDFENIKVEDTFYFANKEKDCIYVFMKND